MSDGSRPAPADDDVDRATRAYEALPSDRPREAADYSTYVELLAPDVQLEFPQLGTPLDDGYSGREAVIRYLTTLEPELFGDLRIEGPLEFLATGSRVVVLGRESYVVPASGVVVREKAFAHLLEFDAGRIRRIVQIKEMHEFIDAHRVAGGEFHPPLREWTIEEINIGLARRFWGFMEIHSSLRSRDLGGGDETLFSMLADDVVWMHEGPRDPRVPNYPGEIHGRQALIDMIRWEGEQNIVSDLNLVDPIEAPLEFIASGNRVVMFNKEQLRFLQAGVTARNRNAVVMDFRDGLVSAIRIIANVPDHVESHLGVGWARRDGNGTP